jgi:hypothetical protein
MENPWVLDDAPTDFNERLVQAIVGVEINIGRLTGKLKASQNQPEKNRAGVKAGLEAGEGANNRAMAFADSPFTGMQDVGILYVSPGDVPDVFALGERPGRALRCCPCVAGPVAEQQACIDSVRRLDCLPRGLRCWHSRCHKNAVGRGDQSSRFCEVVAAVVAACVCATLLARRDYRVSSPGRSLGGGV